MKHKKAAQAISPEVWDALVSAHYRGIYQFARRFLGSGADAEDVTQDTFMTAYQRLDPEIAGERIKAWLFTIARHKCIDRYRSWRRWRDLLKSKYQPDSAAEADDPSIMLQKWVSALPVKQREVFILRHWQGFSTAEAAEIMGISEGTVKSHLVRAIDRLKEYIGGDKENLDK